MSQAQKLFAKTLLLDIHSMPQSSPKLPDIVIGNFNGLSASMEFTNLIIKVINQFGFTFSINKPYAGGFITEYHGKPNENRHAVQMRCKCKCERNANTIQMQCTANGSEHATEINAYAVQLQMHPDASVSATAMQTQMTMQSNAHANYRTNSNANAHAYATKFTRCKDK